MKWEVKVGPEGVEKALDDELKRIVGVGHFEYQRAGARTPARRAGTRPAES